MPTRRAGCFQVPVVVRPPAGNRARHLVLLRFPDSIAGAALPCDAGRTWGVVATIGYEIGNFLQWFWRFMRFPVTPWKAQRGVNSIAYAGSLALLLLCPSQLADWQNTTRTIAGLDPVTSAHPLEVVGTGVAVFLALWIVGRLLGILVLRATRTMTRLLPQRVSIVISTLAVGVLLWSVFNGELMRKVFEVADASFKAADRLIEPEFAQPVNPRKTGSAASLVAWEEMGAEAGSSSPVRPPRPKSRSFSPKVPWTRAGGFERSTLVVMVPVGTGWMDPGGQDTLDFMLGGDVASVAVQYSYLTSYLSILANAQIGFIRHVRSSMSSTSTGRPCPNPTDQGSTFTVSARARSTPRSRSP